VTGTKAIQVSTKTRKLAWKKATTFLVRRIRRMVLTLGQKIFNILINAVYLGMVAGMIFVNFKVFTVSLMIFFIIASEFVWWYNRQISMPLLKKIIKILDEK
jgi:hypothetical protein